MQFLLPFLPLVAHAQNTSPTVKQLVYRISFYVLNPLIKVGFVVAAAFFLWGVVEYLWDRNAGRMTDSAAFGGKGGSADRITYGLFGLFIMVSAFGIMQLIKNLIGSTIQVY
jgi:hypothetical protein